MKHFKNVAFTLALALLALPSPAQVITYVGSSSGGTMPGSPTDFIFFDASTYPTGGPNADNGTTYSQLSSFSFVGGVQGVNGNPAAYSSIVTPAGGTPILTGDIQASGNGAPAFALEPGTAANIGTDGSFNPSFNYNDFNIYLMYSNTGGTHQNLTFTLAPFSISLSSDVGTQAVVSLNGLQAPADTNLNQSTADYLEFNVTGLGAALASDDSLVLVGSATDVGDVVYTGAVSFESVPLAAPEPTTWAMLLGGMGMIFLAQHRRRRQSL